MTTMTAPSCTHDGIHEPGDDEACRMETAIVRADASPAGRAYRDAVEALEAAHDAYTERIVREALAL